MQQSRSIEKIRSLPFFFILGRPRSGTTLLRTLLDVHPNINIPLENSELIHLQFKYSKVSDWDDQKRKSLFSDFLNLNSVKNWGLNREAINELLSKFSGRDVRFEEILNLLYFHYTSEFPKDEIICLGDKSPINSLYADRLCRVFPDAKFIHLVRDYRANFASMSKQDFFSPSSTAMLMQWKKSVNTIQKLTIQNPHRFLLVRYEDLVSIPEETYETICNFLDVKYMPELLDSDYRKDAIRKLYSSEFIHQWQPDLSGKISTSNIDKWKDELSPDSIKKADYIAGKTGQIFQYEPESKKYGLPFILKTELKKILFHLNEMNRYLYDRLPYGMKIRIKNRKFIPSYQLIQFYQKKFGKH